MLCSLVPIRFALCLICGLHSRGWSMRSIGSPWWLILLIVPSEGSKDWCTLYVKQYFEMLSDVPVCRRSIQDYVVESLPVCTNECCRLHVLRASEWDVTTTKGLQCSECVRRKKGVQCRATRLLLHGSRSQQQEVVCPFGFKAICRDSLRRRLFSPR